MPEGQTGARCLLQWKYVTANSCEVAGYDSYDWPTTGEWRQAGSNLAQCDMSSEKYGEEFPTRDLADGTLGNVTPERFWNCALSLIHI